MNNVDLSKLRVNRQPSGAPQPKRRQSRKKWIVIALLLVAALAWWLTPKARPVELTRVVTAWPSEQYQVLQATGYVVARRKAAVASKGTGRVEWLGASEGEFIRKDTVVARLESHDVQAAYRAAQANTEVAASAVNSARTELNDASANQKRSEVLYQQGIISRVALTDAQSRLSRAKAALESANSSLQAAKANEDNAKSAVDYTEIRAPFDGVVIARSANVGDIVTPLSSAADAKGAVLVMADMSTLEINADVSESALTDIHAGQPCEIALDAFPARRFHGEVQAIVPTVNRASATVTTKIRILDTDTGILPDMSARVSFLSQAMPEAGQKPVTAINPKALFEQDGKSLVYRLGKDLKVHAVQVEKGAKLGDLVGIRGAVDVGDNLVLNDGKGIKDDESVKPAENAQ